MPYKVNGTDYNFPDPVLMEDTTFVPLGSVANTAGRYVTWDNLAKIATVELDEKQYRVQADNPKVETPNGYVELQAAPYIEGDALWVPVRFFEQALPCRIEVDGNNVTVQRIF
jgi:hypothetical protein